MKYTMRITVLGVLFLLLMLLTTCVIPNGNVWEGSRGAEGLAIPANLSATAMSPDSVYLSWDNVEGVGSYAVYSAVVRNGAYNLVDIANERSFADTDLNPSTTYYYKVAAVSADGTGPLSGVAQARTLEPGAMSLLFPPSGIVAEALTPKSIRVSWNPVTDGKYNIYRAASYSGEKTKLNASPLANNITSHTDTGLTPSTDYYYFLKTLNAEDAEGPFSPGVRISTPSNIDPSMPIPANVRAEAEGYTAIRISWNSVAGAAEYNVYVSTTTGGTYTILTSTTGLSYLHDNLSPNTTRYYKISAVTANERESNTSVAVSGSTKQIPVPAGLAAEALSYTEIRLSWNSIDDALSYKVYGSSAENGNYTLIDEVASASYTHSGLTQNTTYYYKVSAVVSVGEGGQSAAANATTERAPVTPPGATLVEKLTYIANQFDNGTVYNIVIENDEYITPTSVSTMGQNVTINLYSISSEDIKTIAISTNTGHLFNIASNIKFNISNIILQGSNSNNVALIRVGTGGTLVINTGAEITGNRINNWDGSSGAGIIVQGGTVTIFDGKIWGNENYAQWGASGGGIYIASGGTVTMYGGIVYANKASGNNPGRGAGIFIDSGGHFAKTPLSSGLPSGIIYGRDAAAELANRTAGVVYGNDGSGDAIFYSDSPSRLRNTTMGGFDSISTGNINLGWE